MFIQLVFFFLFPFLFIGNVGVEVSELYLRGSTPERNARVYIGTGDKSYSLGLNRNGDFSVAVSLQGGKDNDMMTIYKDTMAVPNLLARTVHADSLVLRGVPQWQLVREDSFAQPTASFLEAEVPSTADPQHGWTKADLNNCQGLSILTVKDGKTPIAKKFGHLPPHTHVKVVATAHFIDDWQGETAYLRVNDFYAWTDSHELRNSAHALSVCGSPLFPETRFTVPIEVSLPHTDDSINLVFGSTTDPTSQAKFGISSVQIYTRNTKAAGGNK